MRECDNVEMWKSENVKMCECENVKRFEFKIIQNIFSYNPLFLTEL